jgi:hypothetical protein
VLQARPHSLPALALSHATGNARPVDGGGVKGWCSGPNLESTFCQDLLSFCHSRDLAHCLTARITGSGMRYSLVALDNFRQISQHDPTSVCRGCNTAWLN